MQPLSLTAMALLCAPAGLHPMMALVRDINRNGTVDNVTGLFGSSTQDSFAVIDTLDSNGDGVISAVDDAFSDLRVWRDLNQDSVSQANELFALGELGITQISARATDVTGFSPSAAARLLSQLPRSRNLHSTAYAATNDNSFATKITAMVTGVAVVNPAELRAVFQAMSTDWRAG